jgi:hypothetical protein
MNGHTVSECATSFREGQVYWSDPGVVYIEQLDQQYWYFCQSAEAYYPYVTECPSGWMLVLPPRP